MADTEMIPRLMASHVLEAMSDTPVVLLAGPRQAGKTTLVKQIAGNSGEFRYLTLDDALTLLSAQEDPTGMIRSLDRAVIDEIQRAPGLLLAIKKSVDEDRRSGRFLLTGSANMMALPTVADSLAGRMETLSLLPLSQSEISGQTTNWLDHVFAGRLPQAGSSAGDDDLFARVLRGGYPQALTRSTDRRRTAWMRQYLAAIVERDIRDIANIDKLDQLPRLLRALAQMAGQMCNYSQLGSQVGLDHKTAAKYLGIFEQMYLLKRVDVWARNRLKRMVKMPKLQFIDAGLLATLLDLTAEETRKDKTRFGHVLETFVYAELLKHASSAEGDYQLLYYRDADQVEVDVVIENAAGQLVGVEIKSSATVKESDLRGLRKLAGLAGSDFKMGVLLYDGDETLPLGHNIWAAPLSTLWGK